MRTSSTVCSRLTTLARSLGATAKTSAVIRGPGAGRAQPVREAADAGLHDQPDQRSRLRRHRREPRQRLLHQLLGSRRQLRPRRVRPAARWRRWWRWPGPARAEDVRSAVAAARQRRRVAGVTREDGADRRRVAAGGRSLPCHARPPCPRRSTGRGRCRRRRGCASCRRDRTARRPVRLLFGQPGSAVGDVDDGARFGASRTSRG